MHSITEERLLALRSGIDVLPVRDAQTVTILLMIPLMLIAAALVVFAFSQNSCNGRTKIRPPVPRYQPVYDLLVESEIVRRLNDDENSNNWNRTMPEHQFNNQMVLRLIRADWSGLTVKRATIEILGENQPEVRNILKGFIPKLPLSNANGVPQWLDEFSLSRKDKLKLRIVTSNDELITDLIDAESLLIRKDAVVKWEIEKAGISLEFQAVTFTHLAI